MISLEISDTKCDRFDSVGMGLRFLSSQYFRNPFAPLLYFNFELLPILFEASRLL